MKKQLFMLAIAAALIFNGCSPKTNNDQNIASNSFDYNSVNTPSQSSESSKWGSYKVISVNTFLMDSELDAQALRQFSGKTLVLEKYESHISLQLPDKLIHARKNHEKHDTYTMVETINNRIAVFDISGIESGNNQITVRVSYPQIGRSLTLIAKK